MARGAAWGAGHTLALFVICTIVTTLGLTISGTVEASLELVVGLMIAALGLRAFWKLRRERVHVHVHEHGGTWHAHAHSHAGETAPHKASRHRHRHRARALLPTLGVGLVHGAAGSAGLLVLTVAAADSYAEALAAFAVFGIGSLIGMAALTAVASYPLGLVSRSGKSMRAVLSVAVAAFALLVGTGVMLESLEGLARS
jgi:hypothetical protein